MARWSYPRWWIGRLQADHPQHWEAILAAGNARPPLTLRVNRRRTTRDALLLRFSGEGIAASPVGPDGIIVDHPQPVPTLPGYAEGTFSVQDVGAQWAAPLLDADDGMRVLDACAAPGGKTTHLLELAELALTALDRDDARLERVRENVERLGLSARLLAADAGNPGAWWDGPLRPHPRDVPCTASGVAGRHPDGKWLRRKSDLAGFAQQQQRLLAALWPLLAPDGLLLYVTCSVFAAENEGAIDAFAAHARMRCANPSPSPTISRTPEGNSRLRPTSRATIKTAFSTPCSARCDCRSASVSRVRDSMASGRPRAARLAARCRRNRNLLLPGMPLPFLLRSPFPTGPARRAMLVVLATGLLLAAGWTAPARADSIPVKAAELRVEEGEVLLNAEFEFTLNATLEEALQNGVPLYFVLEFELSRGRWYWFDEKLAQTAFTYRVSYNALTRQYRVASGLLTQAFNTVQEVERFVAA